jgi:membrane-bound lytic murein transglycosylase A
MRGLKIMATVLLCVQVTACVLTPQKSEDKLSLKESAFAALPNWSADQQAELIPALQKSCVRILKKEPTAEFGTGGFAGTAAPWQEVCQKLSVLLLATDAEARTFFEENFTPYEVWGMAEGKPSRDGLFTGYYEPMLQGSLTKQGAYTIPLYSRPHDLVTVNLGDFKPELKGEKIMGRVEGENFVPYYKRAEIEKGAIENQHKEIIWVNSAIDAFFLQIQGSGQVRMEDGSVLRVGYATENGQAYTAIGKELIKRGALTKENVSMPSIRDWLEKNPDSAAEVMNVNASYIFFHTLDDKDGVLGAEGVALTPRRSMAVDRKKIPYGVPVWLDAEEPEGQGRLQRLMIAQDTGGAIKGAVRGDFFWGAGIDATAKAGVMKSRGQDYLLLPKAVVVPPPLLH